jgi:hypothetical protein
MVVDFVQMQKGEPMKSDITRKECQECYKRARNDRGTFLFCEAIGYCKHDRAAERRTDGSD